MRFIKLFVACLIFMPLFTQAQNIKIKEETVKMGKTKLWSFTAKYGYTKDAVTDAVESAVSGANLRRSSKKKGFMIYRGAVWQAISNNKADYYYKTKVKNGDTKLYFVVSKGYDNYVTSSNDAEIAANINRFLQNLDIQIATNEKVKNKEAELKQMEQKNETLSKQLNDSKAAENQKAKEIKVLKERPTYDR